MNAAVFSTANESYQVSNINYAGPVAEIPPERRKGESTHSFKMITSMGPVFCHFTSDEAAKKAHGALAGMMERCKPSTYKHGFEVIDTRKIVSYSRVVPFKASQNGHTHAVIVSVESAAADPKRSQVWLRYRSEENATKGRTALFAAIQAANRQVVPVEDEGAPAGQAVTEDLPF